MKAFKLKIRLSYTNVRIQIQSMQYIEVYKYVYTALRYQAYLHLNDFVIVYNILMEITAKKYDN